jgi:outer membrane protein assembly factor BamD (BamD/ComL family)
MLMALCFLLTAQSGSTIHGESKALAPQADQLFERAHTAWKGGQWMEAISLYKQAASTAAEEELSGDAQLHYAEALSF